MAMGRLALRIWEFGLLLLSLVLFFGSAYLYVSDFHLVTFLTGGEAKSLSEQVGTIRFRTGEVRRKKADQPDFRVVRSAEPLFNYDTIVTDSATSATVVFTDGSTIELGPNTMVKLAFVSKFSLGGISKGAAVDVVAGQVSGTSVEGEILLRTGDKTVEITKEKAQVVNVEQLTPEEALRRSLEKSKKEEAAKAPAAPTKTDGKNAQLAMLYPGDQLKLALPDYPPKLELPVDFAWTVDPPNAEVRFSVVLDTAAGKDEVYSEVVESRAGKGGARVTLESPGTFEWQLQTAASGGRPAAKANGSFEVQREFYGVRLIDPLVAGRASAKSNVFQRDVSAFDITLRWREYPDAENYSVTIYKDEQGKEPVFKKDVEDNQYTLNKDRIYAGSIYYRVAAPLESGFVAMSTLAPFRFDFLPPSLVLPVNRAALSRTGLAREGNRILLTWQKTNFTKTYEVQVARDRGFRDVLVSNRTVENFFVIETPPQGTYFWRVRSVADGLASPPSAPYELVIVQ